MDKKESNKDFDVNMGSFDGAEVCELVGLCILHILSTKYGKNINGIYRDHELACFANVSGPQAAQIRKDFIYIFRKEFQLSIACETNLKIVNYKLYNKPGNIIQYINVKSNHPPKYYKELT